MAMTTREFIQHLVLNADLDDPVYIEVKVPDNVSGRYLSFEPAHVTQIGTEGVGKETLVECKPWKEDKDDC